MKQIFEFDDKFVGSMTKIKNRLNMRNNGDVIRHAIALLDVTSKNKSLGGKLMIIDKDQTSQEVILK